MKTKNVDIEKLLASKNAISNKAIQNALAKLEEEKVKKQEETLLKNLEVVQRNTTQAVEALRRARKVEKEKKAVLQTIADAEAKFYEDADFAAYNSAVMGATFFL